MYGLAADNAFKNLVVLHESTLKDVSWSLRKCCMIKSYSGRNKLFQSTGLTDPLLFPRGQEGDPLGLIKPAKINRGMGSMWKRMLGDL